jgi:hypothetical protein
LCENDTITYRTERRATTNKRCKLRNSPKTGALQNQNSVLVASCVIRNPPNCNTQQRSRPQLRFNMKISFKNIIEGIISGLITTLIVFAVTFLYTSVRTDSLSQTEGSNDQPKTESRDIPANKPTDIASPNNFASSIYYIRYEKTESYKIIETLFSIMFVTLIILGIAIFSENISLTNLIGVQGVIKEDKLESIVVSSVIGTIGSVFVIDIFLLNYLIIATIYCIWSILLFPSLIAIAVAGIANSFMEDGQEIVFLVVLIILSFTNLATGLWTKLII